MVQLKKGANKVQLSLTSSFTPLIEFEAPYTGNIHLSKRQANDEERKEATIKASKDEILDLSSYREYFTAYHDSYTHLVVTVRAKAVLDYEPVEDVPVESTVGKTIEFTVKEDPNYNPPDPGTEKCPMCQAEISKSDMMIHIQNKHM